MNESKSGFQVDLGYSEIIDSFISQRTASYQLDQIMITLRHINIFLIILSLMLKKRQVHCDCQKFNIVLNAIAGRIQSNPHNVVGTWWFDTFMEISLYSLWKSYPFCNVFIH